MLLGGALRLFLSYGHTLQALLSFERSQQASGIYCTVRLVGNAGAMVSTPVKDFDAVFDGADSLPERS